jgi:hypothetical protein
MPDSTHTTALPVLAVLWCAASCLSQFLLSTRVCTRGPAFPKGRSSAALQQNRTITFVNRPAPNGRGRGREVRFQKKTERCGLRQRSGGSIAETTGDWMVGQQVVHKGARSMLPKTATDGFRVACLWKSVHPASLGRGWICSPGGSLVSRAKCSVLPPPQHVYAAKWLDLRCSTPLSYLEKRFAPRPPSLN